MSYTAGIAAPAPPYDIAAVPDAAAAREHALNDCQARSASLTTHRATVDCSLGAHQTYAIVEKLRDMSLFQTYATVARRAASDEDVVRISPEDAAKQMAAARATYESEVAKQFGGWKASQPASRGPLFNHTAMPGAQSARDRAVKACGAWSDRKSVKPVTTCVLDADKQFAVSIGLKDMDLFYGYASVLRVDAVDAEDGKRDPAQLASRHDILWGDFLKTLSQASSK